MTKAYQLGFITGILAGLLLLAIRYIKQKSKKKTCYDERQILARGKGFQYGFFTLLFYDLLFNAAYLDGTTWCDNLTGNMFGITLSLCVFGIYCIWNDAYLSLNKKPRLIYLSFSIIMIANLSIGILSFLNGRLIQNGRVNIQIINLLLGIAILLFLITFFFKNHFPHNQSEEESL